MKGISPDRSQHFRINRFFGRRRVLIPSLLLTGCALELAAVCCLHIAVHAVRLLRGGIRSLDAGAHIRPGEIFQYRPELLPGYLTASALVVLVCLILYARIRSSWMSLDLGQKGSAGWTTRRELRRQYRQVPESGKRYPGSGGLLVARSRKGLYLDESPVNNLILGMTRSGKGVYLLFPEIDLYSRARQQSSLVISDPKLELCCASMDLLRSRGYEVHVLNLIHLDQSMGYNPLQLILDAWEQGDCDRAELLCRSLADTIYGGKAGDSSDEFFRNNSEATLSAMILAHIEDALALDSWENRTGREQMEEKKQAFRDLPEKKQEKVRALKALQEGAWDGSREGAERILAERGTGQDVVKALLARLDSCRDRLSDADRYALPEEEFRETHKHRRSIHLYSILTSFTSLAGQWVDERTTKLDLYFRSRPAGDRARIKYSAVEVSGDRTKSSIFSSFLSKLEVFTYSEVARLTAESSLSLEQVGFGERPVALFLGLPYYDHSKDFLASLFLNQLYFALARRASEETGNRCARNVIFLLDEFGNLPPLEGIDSMVTVCLSMGIRFYLVLQEYAQLEEKYGREKAQIIRGNCGNHVYLLSNGRETLTEFSGQLGNRTIVTASRSGTRFSLHKQMTESVDQRPLLYPEELRALKPGETIVLRSMKRTDRRGREIVVRPIANRGRYRLRPYYTYLKKEFPQGKRLSDFPFLESCAGIDLADRVLDLSRLTVMRQQEETDRRRAMPLSVLCGGGRAELFEMLTILGLPASRAETMTAAELEKRIREAYDRGDLPKTQADRYRRFLGSLLWSRRGEGGIRT